MSPNGQSPANKNPKLEQFLSDLNKLTDHYQYSLKPTLVYSPNGIMPTIKVVDKIPDPVEPSKEEKTDAPVEAPAAPAPEDKPGEQVAPAGEAPAVDDKQA